MNLTALFETQRKLDEHIIREKGLEGKDLLPNTILALQVEIGELANEWRGFKHWSNDREPRTQVYDECFICLGTGATVDENYESHKCRNCNGTGNKETFKNPMLEEYVDCLHFILSIGLQLEYEQFDFKKTVVYEGVTVTDMFRDTFKDFSNMDVYVAEPSNANWARYRDGISDFLALGEMLGFTWEQIEEAYHAKNKINHERQETGY